MSRQEGTTHVVVSVRPADIGNFPLASPADPNSSSPRPAEIHRQLSETSDLSGILSPGRESPQRFILRRLRTGEGPSKGIVGAVVRSVPA